MRINPKWALLSLLLVPSVYSFTKTVASHSPSEKAKKFSRLYACLHKLLDISAYPDVDHDWRFIADDLLYFVDRRAPALYLFTPYFAGKEPLVPKKVTLPIWDGKYPYTLQNSNSTTYNLRIPYFPDGIGREKGHYYMTVIDSVLTIYDQPYSEQGRKRIKRLDPPEVIGPHDARAFGLVRFLPGPPISTPDFTALLPRPGTNGITVTSMTGQADKGVTYKAMSIEAKLWDKSEPNDFSAEAERLLVEEVGFRKSKLPPLHKPGDRAQCWGHLGCDWTWTQSMVIQEQEIRREALAACQEIKG